MQLKYLFDRIFREEKDLFIIVFGIFLGASLLLHINLLPFRTDSLVVFFIYLFVTRSLINDFKYRSYIFISLLGLALTTLLSPYGVGIFLFISMLLYKKTRLI